MQTDRQSEKPAPFIKSAARRFFKRLFSRSRLNKGGGLKGGGEREEDDIYSVDIFQLENLILKKIHFHLIKTEEFPLAALRSPAAQKALQSAQTALGEKAALSLLRGRGKEEPVVLVCKTGAISKELARKLRKKGRFNSYFLKAGAASAAAAAANKNESSPPQAP